MAEEKKAGFFKRIASSTTRFFKDLFKRIASSTTRFFKDLKGEMKKIVWPSKKQIINNTGVVIVFVIIAAIAVGGLDFVLNALVRLFNS